MRNVYLLLLLFISTLAFSQEEEVEETQSKKQTYSLSFSGLEIGTAGLSIEGGGSESGNFYQTFFLEGAYNIMTYNDGFVNIDGTGTQFLLGIRTYYGKAKTDKGFYSANSLVYGSINFEKTFWTGERFDGKYRYISFFNPEIGYKIMMGDFSIDPFAGVMWKIQIKGKGDIDNKNIDVWMPRFGFKVGYNF